jgi:precorrin-6B methylase 2
MMRRKIARPCAGIFIGVFMICTVATTALAQQPPNCDRLTKLALPNTTISSAQLIEAGQVKDANVPGALAAQLPKFCRVAATLKPTADSEIKIEVWLPAANWNGRLQGVGNGGLAGSISYGALAAALKEGYATASTDTGHSGTPVSGEWALNHPEKIIDFGHRAVHEMTVAAKAVIKSYYGRAQHHAYWNGCSEGGNQALHEAQRYPQDYDGILAGAPANYMTHLQTGGMWISHAIHKDPASFIASSKLPAINQAVLNACDTLDGRKDGIIDDPRVCVVDFSRLKCSGPESDQCLTTPQLDGLAKVYAGAKNPRSGEPIFPGYAKGSELEWSSWIAGTDLPPKNRQHLIADNLFKYMVFNQAEWDWKTFDFDKDVALADQRASAVNAINPDLRAFKQRGGKLLQYHGWYDPAISAINSINYFASVQKQLGDTKDFYRLFMLPGVAHCGGGPGASEFDRMNTLVRWVEERKAPVSIVAKVPNGNASRLLCPHPQVARYSGDGDDAKSYACGDPAARYQLRDEHDINGLGKYYMGREIAQVMGPGGIVWLERAERDQEEQPALAVDALQLKGGETVVDFGAGSGYYTFKLARAVGPRGTVLAVDVEPKMLDFIRKRAARENLTNVGLLQSTASDPRLPTNRVDLLLMVDVYHELEFPYEVMRKIHAALKPGGRVALVEYRKEDPKVMIKGVHKMTEAQMINEMAAVGLSHVETVRTLPLQHLAIFRK